MVEGGAFCNAAVDWGQRPLRVLVVRERFAEALMDSGPSRGRRVRSFCRVWRFFRLEALLKGSRPTGAVPTTAEGGRLAANYALIAAMSGWTPMMFMTRVRL